MREDPNVYITVTNVNYNCYIAKRAENMTVRHAESNI